MFKKKLVFASLTILVGTVALALVQPRLVRQDLVPPSAEHTELLGGVGEWEGTLTTFMPDGSEQSTPAHESVVAVGGFWIQSRFECEFMGTAYIGTGCTGYDVEKKKYIATWVDSMSSFFALMEGEKDSKTGAMVLRWNSPDMTGTMQPHRSVSTEENGVRKMTFYVGPGEGRKSMVIAMKRKAQEAGAVAR